MTLAGFALSNLFAWHPRNIGALVGISVAIASFVALVSLARGVEDTLLSSLEARGTDVVITESGALDLVSSIVADGLAGDIGAIPGVTGAAPELTRLTSLEDGRSVAVVAWPVGTFPWENLEILDGSLPQADASTNVVLGESLAERLGLGTGDELWLFHARFEITGIVTMPDVLGRHLAYVPLAAAQTLTFRDGQATSINVRIDQTDPDAVLAALRAGFPDLSVEESRALTENYMFGQIAGILAFTISTVALLSAVLMIFNTMSSAVAARRGEIAILSAIGWARWRIVSVLLIEGAVLALVAGIVGMGAGVVIAEFVAARPEVAGFVAPVLGPGLFSQAFGVSLAVGLLGSFLPAYRAVRRPPAEVLRGH